MSRELKIYLVGGAVRDELLGIEADERDWVVVGSTPQEMEAASYRQVGREFPVYLHPETGEDYALARTERKRGRGHTGFECDAGPEVTLEQDLMRRDLTINAIAKDEDGVLIDPYGGVADVAAHVLRHVSPAFAEDPLRVLRVARFAARLHERGFLVADETLGLMRTMARSGELEDLTPERVWRELERALATSSPAMFFHVLAQCQALQILFPELFDGAGLEALERHPGLRAMELLDHAKFGIEERFALLWLERSSARLEQFAMRIKPPTRFRDLAQLVAERCEELLAWGDASASGLLRLIKRVDALRRPERFVALLRVLQLVAASRGTAVELAPLEELAEMLRRLDVSAAAGEAGPKGVGQGVGQGLGQGVGQRVDAERVRAIENWLARTDV